MSDLVLNELSYRTPASDMVRAREWMKKLVNTLSAAGQAGLSRVLRTTDDFHTLTLAPGYPIARWRNDAQVDREVRRLLRSFTTKSPLISAPVNGDRSSEFKYNGVQALGLGVAANGAGMAVSFSSEDEWGRPFVSVVEHFLEDGSDLIQEEVHQVTHASDPIHIQSHSGWIERIIRSSVENGTSAWERRDHLLPGIEFCKGARDTLIGFGSGSDLLKGVLAKLAKLSAYCRGWHSGAFNHNDIGCKATAESASTMAVYSSQRTFPCPDDHDRVFSWHLRVTPDAWRIYYLPLNPGHVLVGYIGPKLPTISDPT